MVQKRILVVDDMRPMRDTIVTTLRESGYEVEEFNSLPDALTVLQTKRFHLAVLDVRLVDYDLDNQDGILLMQEIRELDPTIVCVILTAYPSIDRIRKALLQDPPDSVYELYPSPAYNFVEKNENWDIELTNIVRQAFEEATYINFDLEIQDDTGILNALSTRLKFDDGPRPAPHDLFDEGDELLRKLFRHSTRIELRRVQHAYQGYSRSMVFEVVSTDEEGATGEVLIVKTGHYRMLEDEIQRYRKYARRTGAHRLPGETATKPQRTRSLGGIIYKFAGLDGPVKDFGEYFRTSQIKFVLESIDILFERTLAPWKSSDENNEENCNLTQTYMRSLRLTSEELQEKQARLLADHNFPQVTVDAKSTIEINGQRLLDPVKFALTHPIFGTLCHSPIHGDLHIWNVLVDHRGDPWLIDFADAGDGPGLLDFATFESSMRFGLTDFTLDDLETIIAWERHLTNDLDVLAQPLPGQLNTPNLQKAHDAIVAVRKLALKERGGGEEARRYFTALLFTALRWVTMKFPSDIQHVHALVSAAVLAEKI